MIDHQLYYEPQPPLTEQQRQHLLHDEQLHHSWSVSGRFSSSDPFVLLGSGDPTPVPTSAPSEPTRDDPQLREQTFDATACAATIVAILILLFLLALRFFGGRVPGPEHHRGNLIRQQARRIWAQQDIKARRKAATPAERFAAIRKGVRTATVVRKDPATGACELRITAESNDDEPNRSRSCRPAGLCSTRELPPGEIDPESMMLDSKPSTDTTDTVLLRNDLSDHSDNDDVNYDDGAHDVCQVCLDGFDVGDTVMFARNLVKCTHVFHEECMLSWLLERRENGCPICRTPLVLDDFDDAPMDSAVAEHDESDDGPTNHDGDDVLVALEEGRSGRVRDDDDDDDDCAESLAYTIVRGRVVATTGSGFKDGGPAISSHEATAEGINAVRCNDGASLLVDDLQQRRSPSVASLPCISHKNDSDFLSVPLALRRVTWSFPVHPRRALLSRRRRSLNYCRFGGTFSEVVLPTAAPPRFDPVCNSHQQYLRASDRVAGPIDRQSPWVNGGYGCYDCSGTDDSSSSSSSDDDDDDDSAISRMVRHHLEQEQQQQHQCQLQDPPSSAARDATAATTSMSPRNAASIFAHAHEL